MSGPAQDEEPQSAITSPMKPSSGSKSGHKRNLSNGTPDSSPVRRSKRPKSTINLKELSSSDELEVKTVAKPTPKKTARTSARAASSTKTEPIDDTELVSDIQVGQRDSVTKTEVGDITLKTETEAAIATEKKPAKRGKKSKEEKEAEAMPLAVRTQGLKMFVGAHVSAAKGTHQLEWALGVLTANWGRCVQFNN